MATEPVYFCSHWLVVKIDTASATAEERWQIIKIWWKKTFWNSFFSHNSFEINYQIEGDINSEKAEPSFAQSRWISSLCDLSAGASCGELQELFYCLFIIFRTYFSSNPSSVDRLSTLESLYRCRACKNISWNLAHLAGFTRFAWYKLFKMQLLTTKHCQGQWALSTETFNGIQNASINHQLI